MDFAILTPQGKALNKTFDTPTELEKFTLACASPVNFTGTFGSLFFQLCRNDGFEVWYNNYLIYQSSAFRHQSNLPSLKLQTMLQNDLHADIKGIGAFLLKQHRFNMTYQPHSDCTTYFEVGSYSSFEIHYSASYLEKYLAMLPILQPFLENIANGVASQLLPTHAFVTPQMLSVIQQIIGSGYNDELQKIYFDIKASELLFLALRKAGPDINGHNMHLADMEKMYAAKTWLEENVAHPATLAQIARAVGTNEFKLKKGFKKAFEMTVFDYLLKLRMDRAKQLLTDTDKSIVEIAYLTGYSSHASFTNAFSKHFGFSPLFVRKK